MKMNLNDFVYSYIYNILTGIVKDTSELVINIIITTKTIFINIKTSKEDRGKVIGKKGSIIEAISRLVQISKNINFPEDNKKIIVEVLED